MHTPRVARLALLTVLAAVVAATSIAPAASAATRRYASPAGSGTTCSAASPCAITQAVTGAVHGDEVIINPGGYPLTATLTTPDKLTIHGVAGKPRPRLLFSGAAQEGLKLTQGSLLRYVEVDQAAAARAVYASTSTVDQIIARGTGPGYQTALILNSEIRNSVVVASGVNGRAIATTTKGGFPTSTYRNVTAITTGSGGVAIEAQAQGGATNAATIHLINVIAYGGPGALSLLALTDGSGAQATITVTHTNYQSVDEVGLFADFVDGGGNRAEEPVFVNPAAGDYRQAPGAYTIGAGLDDSANGTFDVDGDPRRIGTTDIGADEFVPAPTAITGSAGAVTGESATLSGSVNAHGAPTTYHFEYGPTTAYGRTAPNASAGSGTGAVAAGATLGGLSRGTTYHYRIVATNAGGATTGADRSFTAASAPAPPPRPFVGVALVSRRLSYARRFITVRLTCPAGIVGRCFGRTTLTVRRPAISRRVTLGRARFSIAAGNQTRVRVRVSRAGRRLFRTIPRLRARAVNAARDGAGRSKTTVGRVTIRRRQR